MDEERDGRGWTDTRTDRTRRGERQGGRPPRRGGRDRTRGRGWPCPCLRSVRSHRRRAATASYASGRARRDDAMQRPGEEPELQANLRDEWREGEDERGGSQVGSEHDGR